jgi:DNA-binding LacI/PurR family transcriptional regulator
VSQQSEQTKAATIFDVARLAGVSHQTVSRVLNEHPSVRDTTRQRVQEAIQQLRYRPNIAARAMAKRGSRNIGLVSTGSADYGPNSTVLGFSAAAHDARFTVTVTAAQDDDSASLRSCIDLLLDQHVAVIVLVAPRTGVLDALQGIDIGVPMVVVNSSARSLLPSISIDQYAGGRLATEHLITLGHRQIVHLAGPADSVDAIERVRGWRDVMSEHGLVAHPPFIGDWSPRSGSHNTEAALAAGYSFTAIFSANDQMALGCIAALRRHRLTVPGDISLIGFDDLPEAEYFQPPLTTMRQDFYELGRDIMATVLTVLSADPGAPTPRHLPVLLVRDSTRPVA